MALSSLRHSFVQSDVDSMFINVKKESQLQFTSLGGFNPHRPAGFCKKDRPPGTSEVPGPAAQTLSYQM